MRKIQKNDEVIVLKGKDKGKKGKVLGFDADDNVLVEGINRVKRHRKPNPSKGITGGIVEIYGSISVANVAIVNPHTNKADRVGFRLLADGRKVRFFKATNDIIGA